ncbi:MAG: DUF5688 family protein [Hungatella sp.]|nr:DUF5688 family protein [Hungatella sp.]
MMKYEEFESAILKEIRATMGDDYRAVVQKITKNNGLILAGITITRQEDRVSPVIYLEPYFTKYNRGMGLEEILEEILRVYEDSKSHGKEFAEYSFDFDQLRDRVAFKLICQKSNKELLSDVPNTPYLDLAIVYYILWDTNDLGQAVMLIRNSHLKKWGVTKEELHRLAQINTERLRPANIRPIQDVMYDMIKAGVGEEAARELCDIRKLDEDARFPMFVLSNEKSLNGACCILYENFLGKFAERKNADIIILPSSVHETLLVPAKPGMDLEYFEQVVREVNDTLETEEILSDSIYIYKRKDGTIHLAA